MRLQEVREQLNRPVEYRGSRYQFTACILRKAGELWKYSAELKDAKANSVVIVPLQEVMLR